MIDPLLIRINPSGSGGWHESLTVVACSADGNVGFSLHHTLLRQAGQRFVTVRNILVLHNHRTGTIQCTQEQEDISPEALRHTIRQGSWERLSYNFSSGSYFEIGPTQLRGRMHTRQGSSSWELQTRAGQGALLPFASERLYTLPWPPRKLVLPEVRLALSGRLSCAGKIQQGEFSGGSRHVWGSGEPAEYAFAACNRLAGGEAHFCGLSARLAVPGTRLRLPLLSLAVLHAGGQEYAFNTLALAPRQSVQALDNYRWLASFRNSTHRLDVTIDGANPRVEPWVALQETGPDGRRRLRRRTLFAAGRLRLCELGEERPLLELASETFELETRRADSEPEGPGLLGKP